MMSGERKILKIEEIIDLVEPVLSAYGVSKAWVFGSYARGDATVDSDVDLHIEGCTARGLFGMGRMYDELCMALKKDVDMVTSEALSHKVNIEATRNFRNEIENYEMLIYEKQG